MSEQIVIHDSQYPIGNYADFLGLASTGESYKRSRAYLKSAKNVELTKSNKIVKARGYEQLGTATWNNNRIKELMQYRTTNVDVLLGFGVSGSETSGAIATVSSQWTTALTFTETLSLSDFSTVPCMFQIAEYAYMFNGTDDKFYNGTSWAAIGCSAPSGSITYSTDIAGEMTVGGIYKFAWRWYDSTSGRRSDLSPLSNAVTIAVAPNDGVRLTIPTETAPTGYDKIEVLATLAFGNQLFVDQSVNAGTTTVDVTQSDFVRKENSMYEGVVYTAPSRKYDIATAVQGVVYAARTDDGSCKVEYSYYSPSYGPMPQSWPAKHFVNCDPSASDKIVAIGYCGAQQAPTIIVLKQKSFGKFVQVAPQRYIYQKIADIGCFGQKSVFNMGEMIGWVDGANCYLSNGSSYVKIGGGEDGEAVSDTFSSMNQQYRHSVYSCHVPSDKQIRISWVRQGQIYPDRVLIGHYHDYQNIGIVKWTTREAGPNTSTHKGVLFSSMIVVLDDTNNERVVAGNSNASGKLFDLDTGTTDDSHPIYMEIEFKPEDFGDPRNEKLFTDIVARCRTGNSSTDVIFGVKSDLSNTFESVLSETLSGSGFTFGTAQFGVTSFTNSPVNLIVIPVQRRSLHLSFVIRQITDDTFELLDFQMTGAL